MKQKCNKVHQCTAAFRSDHAYTKRLSINIQNTSEIRQSKSNRIEQWSSTSNTQNEDNDDMPMDSSNTSDDWNTIRIDEEISESLQQREIRLLRQQLAAEKLKTRRPISAILR